MLKALPAVIFVALVVCSAPPPAFAQRAGSSRGSNAGARDGGNSAAQPSAGPIQPGTPGSAYRFRTDGRPFATRGIRGRGYSALWWGLTYIETPDTLDAKSREIDIEPAPPRRADLPAESSLIQPLLTLPRPQRPQTAHGSLHVEVAPNIAQMYVDGFFVGTVEDVARLGAGLDLSAGWHRLEFRAPGYMTPAVNVTIEANRTLNYRGELKPIAR